MVIDILSWILIIIGGVFSIISAVGLLRLPDVFTRMHAVGIGDTLALGALCAGMMLQAGWTIVTIKLFLILLFVFFAAPTTTHALAKAALAGGLKPLLSEDRIADEGSNEAVENKGEDQ
ncbi:MAG: monovalent cation/H(+) antiporter subunit G [Rhodospirillaceae bacterium]|nr:monovalent cation/H(+) antiporter subunit G [Rhodospirillaceae bacterium]